MRLGDRYVLSTVEVIEPTQRYQPPGTIIDGTDRTPGKGIGHLIAFDGEGNLLADQRVDDGANIYHPGGLDYDGRHLWVAVAEYRPNKPSIIFRVDPTSLATTEVLRTPDHIGGIGARPAARQLVRANWGSRPLHVEAAGHRQASADGPDREPSHSTVPACKYLGGRTGLERPAMLCGGIPGLRAGPAGEMVSHDLGGVAIVEERQHEAGQRAAVPRSTRTSGSVATRNAIDVQIASTAAAPVPHRRRRRRVRPARLRGAPNGSSAAAPAGCPLPTTGGGLDTATKGLDRQLHRPHPLHESPLHRKVRPALESVGSEVRRRIGVRLPARWSGRVGSGRGRGRTSELPLERRGDLFVAAAEREQALLDGDEVGEVVRGRDLALDDAEVDLGRGSPARVDRGVDGDQVWPGAV